MLTSWGFVKAFYYVFGIGGIVANAFLLPIVFLCGKKSIGSYRFLMACFVSSSLFTSIANTILMPMMSVNHEGWLFYSVGVQMPQKEGSYFLVLFCISVIVVLQSLMFAYIDRLTVFYEAPWFTGKKKLYIMGTIFTVVTVLWAYQTVVFLLPTDRLNYVHEENLNRIYGLQIRDVSYIAAESYVDGVLGFNFGFVFISRLLITSSCFTAMILCAFLIHRRLVADLSMINYSAQKSALERKLFRVLIFQTSVPAVFTYTPVFISILMAFFRFDFPVVCEIISFMLPVAQFLDPLIIIVFVSEYRKAFGRAITSLSGSTASTSKVSSVPTK